MNNHFVEWVDVIPEIQHPLHALPKKRRSRWDKQLLMDKKNFTLIRKTPKQGCETGYVEVIVHRPGKPDRMIDINISGNDIAGISYGIRILAEALELLDEAV